MLMLMLHGLYLDAIADLVKHMITAGVHPVNVALFLAYTFIGEGILFNMLIGLQCNVATQVLEEDEHHRNMQFLQVNMLRLLLAFDQDGDKSMDSEELETMLQDPEVYSLL